MDCNFCSKSFTRKDTLKRHIKDDRCSLEILNNKDKLFELNELIENLKKRKNLTNNIKTNNGSIVNGNNINISIVINPISKLEVGYIDPDKMKKFVEDYTYNKSELLISDYIKEMIHNKDHPENHCVKYITKRPPTYVNLIDEDNQNINVIKNLKDSCELLSEPVLSTLKKKLKECKRVFKNDQEFQDVYEDTVSEIYRQLNRDSVKKALKTVLQNDVLNDIEMKISMLNVNDK
jgi:hypothetical protein